jgi:hypothetical protein
MKCYVFENNSMIYFTIWANTGKMILATAVLDDTSVRKVVAVATMMRIKNGGSTWRYTSSLPRYVDRPDSLLAAAIAKPPPKI